MLIVHRINTADENLGTNRYTLVRVCVCVCTFHFHIIFFFFFFASVFNMAYACLFVVGDENRVYVYKSMRVRTCVSFKIGRCDVLAYTQQI